MFTPELASLDFQECNHLPPGTVVAPLTVLREIRCAVGPTGLKLVVGEDEVVHVSSDLYAAFQAWEASQTDQPDTGEDKAWLN